MVVILPQPVAEATLLQETLVGLQVHTTQRTLDEVFARSLLAILECETEKEKISPRTGLGPLVSLDCQGIVRVPEDTLPVDPEQIIPVKLGQDG